MIDRLRSLPGFHPDLRWIALLAPRRTVTPRSLPVLRTLTADLPLTVLAETAAGAVLVDGQPQRRPPPAARRGG